MMSNTKMFIFSLHRNGTKKKNTSKAIKVYTQRVEKSCEAIAVFFPSISLRAACLMTIDLELAHVRKKIMNSPKP